MRDKSSNKSTTRVPFNRISMYMSYKRAETIGIISSHRYSVQRKRERKAEEENVRARSRSFVISLAMINDGPSLIFIVSRRCSWVINSKACPSISLSKKASRMVSFVSRATKSPTWLAYGREALHRGELIEHDSTHRPFTRICRKAMIRWNGDLFVDCRCQWEWVFDHTCRLLNRRCSVMLKFLSMGWFDHLRWFDRACAWAESRLLVVESLGEVHFLALETTQLIRTEITLIIVEAGVLFLAPIGNYDSLRSNRTQTEILMLSTIQNILFPTLNRPHWIRIDLCSIEFQYLEFLLSINFWLIDLLC